MIRRECKHCGVVCWCAWQHPTCKVCDTPFVASEWNGSNGNPGYYGNH